MKHFSLIFLFTLLLAGCQDTLGPAGLEVSENMISCPAEGGDFLIEIDGRPDWTTDNTVGWISVRRTNGNASIHIDGNEGKARRHTLNLLISGRKQAEIEITQEHSDAFSISRKSIQMPYKGGECAITLTCFTQWQASSDSEWISLEDTSGNGTSEVGMTIAPNEEHEDRKGCIIFTCEGKSIEMPVIQSLKPFVEVEKQTVEFDGDGGQGSVLYLSNTMIETSSQVDWIRIIKPNGTVNKVSFEVKRNLGEAREGRIRVASDVDKDIFSEITVRQGPKIDHPRLLIAEGSYLILHSRESITLTPIFEDMSDKTLKWSSDNEGIATVDDNGRVTIISGGICTITATNAYHGLQVSITLDIRPKATDMKVKFGKQDMNENPVAVRFAGEAITISVTMDPEDAYCEDLTYLSSDESIAGISGNIIRCLRAGKVEIFIESAYQSLRQSYILTILE